MTGARSYTTKIWRQPSSIGFSSADALSTSMDPPGEPVISTQKRPCQKIQNGSEFPELVAQNFRNPQYTLASPQRSPTRTQRTRREPQLRARELGSPSRYVSQPVVLRFVPSIIIQTDLFARNISRFGTTAI